VTLPHGLAPALAAVGEAMAPAQEPWWLVGSAAMALHGAEIDVADIDILMGQSDMLRLFEARMVAARPSNRFRSRLFARWREGAYPVEAMAGFHVRTGGQWRPFAPAAREGVRFRDGWLYTPGVEGLAAMCVLFGREKDRTRRAELEALLNRI
jgi:hypothetical protein